MAIPVNVHILDKEYQVACEEHERDGLLRAAEYINRQMKDVRDRGNVIGTDRIAVVTALNMAHELLQLKAVDGELDKRLSELHDNVTTALAAQSGLSL